MTQHTNLYDLAAIISQLGTFSGSPNALEGASGVFQDLSKRQRAVDQQATAKDKLDALIGNASVPGIPFDINRSPQLPVEPIAGTGFAGQSGLQTQQVEMLKNLAGVSPEIVTKGIGDSLFKEPQKLSGDVQQFIQARELGLISENTSFEDFINTIKKPSTIVNVGKVKPIGSNAVKFINAKGENPSVLATLEEIQQGGFKPTTTDQRKSILSASEAAPLMGELINLSFGRGRQKSLFPSDTESFLSRMAGGISAKVASVTDSNQRIALYNKTKDALVTGLARLVGQVGTLTDTDVDTVAGLFPTIGMTPQAQAKAQFKQIATLLRGKGVPRTNLIAMGFPSWALESNIKRPTTQAQMDAIQPGEQFFNPADGLVYIKK